MTIEHKNITAGDNHVIANWEFASIAARDAASYTVSDIGKIAHVSGYGCFFLADNDPVTWEAFGVNTVAAIYATEADAAAAAATYVSADVGKIVAVVSSRTFYYVYSVAPVVMIPIGLRTVAEADHIVANAAALAGISVTADNLYSTAYTLDTKRMYVLTGVGPAVWTAIDAYALQRSSHTGTQPASTISDFADAAKIPVTFATFADIDTTGWTSPRLLVVVADETNAGDTTCYLFAESSLFWIPMVAV